MVPGKKIVNSISLKVGRRKIQRTGFVIEEAWKSSGSNGRRSGSNYC